MAGKSDVSAKGKLTPARLRNNKGAPDDPVLLSDLAGQALANLRSDGSEIVVPEVA